MSDHAVHGLFTGPGEMRSRCRDIDWGETPLGPVEAWSPALRGAVRMCLTSPFPINLWCGDELILIYNDGYRDVLGTKHPRALGRPGWEAWSEIWPEIRPMFQRIRAGGPPVFAADAPFHVQRAGGAGPPLPPGKPNAWFTFSLSPVRDESGTIVAFLNIVSETTGRILAERERTAARARAERAEARMLDIFRQAPAFMAVVRGPDHVVEYVNDAYYQLVGQRELVGRPILEALPEIRGQGYEELLTRVFETGEPYVGREMPVVLARSPDHGSEERWVDFVYYPITEGDGTRSGVVAHGSDVTQYVQARREAQRARAEAEEANRAKSRFLASMSHELRTPMNAVIGYVDLLQMEIAGPLTDGQRTQLERVLASSRHLLMLIDDILDLTKVESGRIEIHPRRARLAPAVADSLALVEPQARERDIELVHRCDPENGRFYTGDEDRVRQILVNILSNAVKFTPRGGHVAVECGSGDPPDPEAADWSGPPDTGAGSDGSGTEGVARRDDTGRWTYVAVSDTGIGIAPEQMGRIFQPFTQVESGPTRVHGGAGLGLAISRELAALMGGRLTATSRPGQGSTFVLWLPE